MFKDHMILQYVFTQNELNLYQRRSLKFLEDYNKSILYHPSKANVVAYTLSRMTMCTVYHVEEGKKDLVKNVHRFEIGTYIGRFPK